MTTAADDSAVEEAFEAYLAGRDVPVEGADLAAFAGAVRMAATERGRPNAALAELLATGLLLDQPSPSVRTAKRRRRRMWFFSVIFAKIASAGAIAQAATGAGIVLVGFTGVGAAGALPGPVQHTFATVVATISPLSAPDVTTTVPVTTTELVTSTPAAPTTGAADPTRATGALVGAPADATTSAPKNRGEAVSSDAHERNAERKADHNDGTHDTEGTDGTDGTDTAAPTSPETGEADASHGATSDGSRVQTSDGHGSSHGDSGHGNG